VACCGTGRRRSLLGKENGREEKGSEQLGEEGSWGSERDGRVEEGAARAAAQSKNSRKLKRTRQLGKGEVGGSGKKRRKGGTKRRK